MIPDRAALRFTHCDEVIVRACPRFERRGVEVPLALAGHVRVEVPLAALLAFELAGGSHPEALLEAPVGLVLGGHGSCSTSVGAASRPARACRRGRIGWEKKRTRGTSPGFQPRNGGTITIANRGAVGRGSRIGQAIRHRCRGTVRSV